MSRELARSAPALLTLCLRMSAAASVPPRAPKWDAKNGVWEGNMASGGVEIPKPLWIFGYGSLCFRADFPYEEKFVGRVSGWRRYFAQKSADHRGTPESPGLVATLLTDAQLAELGVRSDAEPASSCVGVCYRVSEAETEAVLANLDFREKGGYTREIIDVTPSAGGPPVRALLYSATPANPGFTPVAIRSPQLGAQIISEAVGPSGANIDYLLRLVAWLEEVGERDAHAEELAAKLGPRRHVRPK